MKEIVATCQVSWYYFNNQWHFSGNEKNIKLYLDHTFEGANKYKGRWTIRDGHIWLHTFGKYGANKRVRNSEDAIAQIVEYHLLKKE